MLKLVLWIGCKVHGTMFRVAMNVQSDWLKLCSCEKVQLLKTGIMLLVGTDMGQKKEQTYRSSVGN